MSAPNVQILHQQPAPEPSKNWTDVGPSTGRSQRLMRYTSTLWDQHKHPTRRGGLFTNGRPWWGEMHRAANRDDLTINNGMPLPDGFVGPLTPGEHVRNDQNQVDRQACLASHWEAPWYPLAKYFKFNYEQRRISFDYVRMRMEELASRRDYWKAAAKLGARLGLVVNSEKAPHSQIVDVLGEPTEMHHIAEAAIAGDPWLFGFRDDPNEALAKILGFHPMSGVVATSFSPEAVQQEREAQAERVEVVNAAPESMDLVTMLAELIDRKFAERDRQAAEKKAADKARMDKIRPKKKVG